MLQDTLTHGQDRNYFTRGKIKAPPVCEDVSCLLEKKYWEATYIYNGM